MAKMGRPVKYDNAFIENLADKLCEWMQNPQNWFLTDFAIENDIWEQRFMEFSNKNEYFSETLKKAKQLQTARIVKLAMAKKIDTTMAIFTLKNVSEWRDLPEQKESDATKGQAIEFIDVPSNGGGRERFKQYIEN